MVKTYFKYLTFLFFLSLFGREYIHAQIKVVADERIEQGLQEYVLSIDTNSLSGYRVQVYFGSNKFEAEKAKGKAIEACPQLSDKVYIIYQSPNYKVRVGNFEREIDAQRTLQILGTEFPNVFVVRDRIEVMREFIHCE